MSLGAAAALKKAFPSAGAAGSGAGAAAGAAAVTMEDLVRVTSELQQHVDQRVDEVVVRLVQLENRGRSSSGGGSGRHRRHGRKWGLARMTTISEDATSAADQGSMGGHNSQGC